MVAQGVADGSRLPVVAVTLKHRMLSPPAEIFIHEVRAVTKGIPQTFYDDQRRRGGNSDRIDRER